MFRLLFSHPQVLLNGCKLQGAVRTLGSQMCLHVKLITIGLHVSTVIQSSSGPSQWL